MSLISRGIGQFDHSLSTHNVPEIRFSGMSEILHPWVIQARERIFSLAAGNRAGKIAPRIMELGLAKVMYAANSLGADMEKSKPYAFFAPDGTITYNKERISRGFSYGCALNLEFEGMTAVSNSMPNGCGFSIYEIIDPMADDLLIDYLRTAQNRLGKEQISQLGKGNHFAGVYIPRDPVTGEDTNRRFVVVHCSGHVGGELLYFPETWLANEEGYHKVDTPHGPITLLEGEARKRYVAQFQKTDKANAKNRDITMDEIFETNPWRRLEEITHQGLTQDGSSHIIGTQKHKGMMPIAFNPEEGLVAVKTKPNLNSNFMDYWDQGERAKSLGFQEQFTNLNLTPHGAGYEFRHPLKSLEVQLSPQGISKFTIEFTNLKGSTEFSFFREIRHHMTYRRRAPIMREVDRADLAEIVFELPSLMQIYPITTIVGGTP